MEATRNFDTTGLFTVPLSMYYSFTSGLIDRIYEISNMEHLPWSNLKLSHHQRLDSKPNNKLCVVSMNSFYVLCWSIIEVTRNRTLLLDDTEPNCNKCFRAAIITYKTAGTSNSLTLSISHNISIKDMQRKTL
jgi:hypothetical protein